MKRRLLAACLGAVFLFIVWLAAVEIIQLPIVPSPIRVAKNIGEIFFDGIAVHFAYSFGRILAGLLLAVVVGLPVGEPFGQATGAVSASSVLLPSEGGASAVAASVDASPLCAAASVDALPLCAAAVTSSLVRVPNMLLSRFPVR